MMTTTMAPHRRALALLLLLLLLLSILPLATASSFVAVSGSQLTLDGAPFYFVGGNAHQLTDPSTGQGGVDAVLGAASAVGMRVIRTWAFHSNSASMAQLDYVVKSAQQHGLRLILALGNTWKAGGGPEQYLDGGAAGGKTIADFYASRSARDRYKAHVIKVISAYKDDPTVMGYDAINEGRCPGCDGAQRAARNDFLDEMIAAIKENATRQLVFAGSEGFYGPGSSRVSLNPGAGSACEGDDFEGDSSKASVAVVHAYFRQVEGSSELGWAKPGFDSYIPYLAARIDMHAQVAQGLGQPLIIEEWGLTSRFFDADQVKAAVAVVLDRLVASKQRGGELSGALIWGLVGPGGANSGNEAGYNLELDGGAAASNVGLGSGRFSGGGGGNASASAAAGAPRRRHLQVSFQDVVEDELDAFRRGPQRAACANARASGWTFPYSFAKGSGVDAEAVKAAVSGSSISSLFKEAAENL